MDTALLLLRVAVGLLLIGHGTQKLFGWLGGYGLAGTGGFFHSLGFRPGKPMAAAAGLGEAGGGLLLTLGLLSPLAGAVIVGTLLVASSTHLDKGVWGANGGYELPLIYAVVGATVALAGPGSVSLDAAFGIDDNWSTALGAIAIAAGVAAAATVVARARLALRADVRDAAASGQPDTSIGAAA
jgi:putative oxidoreductase